MDTIELQELLDREFGDLFIFHPKFIDEFVELLKNSGVEFQLLNQFTRKLYMIIELGNIDCGLPWLEKLKKCEDLYSLHLKGGNKNFRLLFTKTSGNKYFLRAFYEKSGKSKTSYAPNIKIALERME